MTVSFDHICMQNRIKLGKRAITILVFRVPIMKQQFMGKYNKLNYLLNFHNYDIDHRF